MIAWSKWFKRDSNLTWYRRLHRIVECKSDLKLRNTYTCTCTCLQVIFCDVNLHYLVKVCVVYEKFYLYQLNGFLVYLACYIVYVILSTILFKNQTMCVILYCFGLFYSITLNTSRKQLKTYLSLSWSICGVDIFYCLY